MKPYFDQLPRIPFPSMVTFPTTKSLVGTPASASIHLPANLETTANMSTTQEMLRESVALTHALNRVESLIAMLIPGKKLTMRTRRRYRTSSLGFPGCC